MKYTCVWTRLSTPSDLTESGLGQAISELCTTDNVTLIVNEMDAVVAGMLVGKMNISRIIILPVGVLDRDSWAVADDTGVIWSPGSQ